MKYILVFIFGILFNKSNAQEQDLPYNLNRAYIKGVKEYKIIKVITTYNKGDYRAESIHYYDKFNKNYLTVDNYKDTLNGRYYFKFDKKGRVKRENNHNLWVGGILDTSKISWIIDWSYYPNGLAKKVDNTWFDEKKCDNKNNNHLQV